MCVTNFSFPKKMQLFDFQRVCMNNVFQFLNQADLHPLNFSYFQIQSELHLKPVGSNQNHIEP